jgi:hypothetical protein
MWLKVEVEVNVCSPFDVPHLHKIGKGEVPCLNKSSSNNNGTRWTRPRRKQHHQVTMIMNDAIATTMVLGNHNYEGSNNNSNGPKQPWPWMMQ